MIVYIYKESIKFVGHMPDEVSCAGVSGIVSAFMISYPDETTILQHTEDKNLDEIVLRLTAENKKPLHMIEKFFKELSKQNENIQIKEKQ